MRVWFLLLSTLMFTLGCMGAVNSLTDLDLQVEFGENAVHPPDFPASAPASGTKTMSMSMTTGADSLNVPDGVKLDLSGDVDYRMELVAYEIAPADAEGLMKAARAEVEGAGFTLEVEEQGVLTFDDGGTKFVLMDPEESDGEGFVLIRVSPVKSEASP